MSNPARAERFPLTRPGARRDYHPDCHVQYMSASPPEGAKTNAWQDRMRRAQDLKLVVEGLKELDMEMAAPFMIPREHTVAREAFNSAKPFYALAKKGRVSTRPRTNDARVVAQAAYALLPPDVKVEVFDRATVTFLADGGAEFTMGRFDTAYPKKGSRVFQPITPLEAHNGWLSEVGPVLCDKDQFAAYVDDAERSLYALYATEENAERVVRANLSAGNGYPVLGKGSDDEARSKYLGLAESVLAELEAAHAQDADRGVEKWLYTAFEERPWLVALMGKAKADYITPDKLWALKMRFYNVLGRHMALLIQQATQPFEELSQSVLDGGVCRSSSGLALNRGGAAKLVDALENQLGAEEQGHTRMGDDSWLQRVVPVDERLHLLMLALDASNFDLTQHADLTREVHKRLLALLSQIDALRAQLLHSYQRKRLVTLVERVSAYLRHGGPSGLPLQSKVNGVVMGVAIERVFKRLDRLQEEGSTFTQAEVSRELAFVGRGMGISIKLEQYSLTPLRPSEERQPVRAALRRAPFLYLGYNFYCEDGRVGVYADMPRTMAQLRYPSLTWVDSAQEMRRMEASRLAATVLSWGEPTRALTPAFDAARKAARKLVATEINKNGDWEDSRLRWATQLSAQLGPDVPIGSLRALALALDQPYADFWQGGDVDISPASSEREEEGVFTVLSLPEAGVALPSAASMAPPAALPSRKPTYKTAGRNPPTKVFAPALPPRPPQYRAHESLQWVRGEDRWNEEIEQQADEQAVAQLTFGSFQNPNAERRARTEDGGDFLAEDDENEPDSAVIDADTREGEIELQRLRVGQYIH